MHLTSINEMKTECIGINTTELGSYEQAGPREASKKFDCAKRKELELNQRVWESIESR